MDIKQWCYLKKIQGIVDAKEQYEIYEYCGGGDFKNLFGRYIATVRSLEIAKQIVDDHNAIFDKADVKENPEEDYSQHAPGPWRDHPEDDPDERGVYANHMSTAGDIVCLPPDNSFYASRKYWPANRRLIIQAPEMFKLLKHLVAAFDAGCHYRGCSCDLCAVSRDAKPIIQKVEGRS